MVQVDWRLVSSVVVVLAIFGVATYFAERSDAARPGTMEADMEAREDAPITAPSAPDDDASRALRASLVSTEVPVEPLLLLGETGGERIYGVVVPGADALDHWRALRAAVDASGRWPVVLGGAGDAELLFDEGTPSTPRAAIERAESLDVDGWLAARRVEFDWVFLRGHAAPSPLGPREPGLTIGTHLLSGRPLAQVLIALVPTRDGTEAPAWLGYGGWNDCPAPEVHVALLRRWRDRYGAELYGIGGAVLETLVSRPPADREAAVELALEHTAYAYDIVAQGTTTVDGLAAELLGAPTWYFWWD